MQVPFFLGHPTCESIFCSFKEIADSKHEYTYEWNPCTKFTDGNCAKSYVSIMYYYVVGFQSRDTFKVLDIVMLTNTLKWRTPN